MNYRLNTRYDEMCLVITVAVKQSCEVVIKIHAEDKPKIVFTDRWATVRDKKTFYVRLPITSENIIISVYDKKIGNLPKGQDKNITILEVNKTPLEKRLDVVDIKNMTVANFVDFAQRFSYNAPYLSANKTYQSDNGEFLIEYLPVIVSANTGKELSTPARISRLTGRIQVAKKHFDDYTVPMRFAILCHEFSHFYVNDDIDNESEADINGLLIYLGLGYPRIEGLQAFYEVFKETDSQQNLKRMKIIEKFVMDFEKNKMVLR
jgi:hypothetical protein